MDTTPRIRRGLRGYVNRFSHTVINVSDLDRHYYAEHGLTVARHPSETELRMMVRIPAVQLQDHAAVERQLFIFAAAVGALAAQYGLVPAARGFDVGHGDQGLRLHGHLR